MSAHVASHVAYCGFHSSAHTHAVQILLEEVAGFFVRAVVLNLMRSESVNGARVSQCQEFALRLLSISVAISISVASLLLFSRLPGIIVACAVPGPLCHTLNSVENVWPQSLQTCTTLWSLSKYVLYYNVAVNHGVT